MSAINNFTILHNVAASSPAISYFQAVVLGVLQGVSELFPISSLGHTVLFPTLFGWSNLVKVQSQTSDSYWLAFLVALHVGSALGLLAYFWRDWVVIVRAFFATLAKRRIEGRDERMAWLIILASIPAGVIALALQKPLTRLTAKPQEAAIFLMVNGLVLLIAEAYRRRDMTRQRAHSRALARQRGESTGEPAVPTEHPGERELATLEYREALVIGVAQSTALIAGISRDGVTMGAGLARGMNHSDSARFAFLLATPIIFAAGLYKLPTLLGHNGAGIRGQALVACLAAAVTAFFVVAFLVRYFKTRTLGPFAAYCLLFGLAMTIYTAT